MAAVTGATGFLGGVLCRQLKEQGYRVRGLARDRNRAEALRETGIDVAMGDVRDVESLDSAFQDVDVVFHVAALFRQQGVPDQTFWDVNVKGTTNVLSAAKAARVRRLVHCSTVGVHSHIPKPPANESEPYRPDDIYQVTKCEGEKIALDWFRRSDGIDGCVVRPAMIWGPNDERTLKLFRGIARRRLPIIGHGRTLLHWVLVDDVARGMRLAAETSESTGKVYIIAGERPVQMADLYAAIAREFGVSVLPFKCPALPVQVLGEIVERICRPLQIEPPLYRRRVDFFTKTRAFDWSRAHQELGYTPGQPLDEEIRLIVDSYRKEGLV